MQKLPHKMRGMDKELLKRLGANITKARKAKGLTVQQLANDCDIEKSNLIPIEKGRINITINTLSKIAKVLGLEPQDLFN